MPWEVAKSLDTGLCASERWIIIIIIIVVVVVVVAAAAVIIITIMSFSTLKRPRRAGGQVLPRGRVSGWDPLNATCYCYLLAIPMSQVRRSARCEPLPLPARWCSARSNGASTLPATMAS